MRYIILVIGFVFILVACNKDKFQTKPQLKLESTSDKNIPVNGSLKVKLEFTDKEGDLDTLLVMKKYRMNVRVVPTIRDSIGFTLPPFPETTKGVFELDLTWGNYLVSALNAPTVIGSNPVKKESDSLKLVFYIKDKAGNKSDSLIISDVVVQRN
jgi:hypothetical protein